MHRRWSPAHSMADAPLTHAIDRGDHRRDATAPALDAPCPAHAPYWQLWCPIRNFLRVRGSADRRTLNWLWTASGQEIHDNVRVPDEIQKDLRASEWLIRSIQRRHGHRIAPCDFHTRVAPRSGGCASGLRGRSATDLPSNRSQAPRARRRYEKIARTAIRAGRFRLR